MPGFVALWLSAAASAFTWSLTSVAVGWLALEATGSSLAVGLTFAARLTPALLLGIPIGVLVDRVDRRRMLIGTNLAGTAVYLLLASAPPGGAAAIAALVLASIALGAVETARGTASRAYAFDLAGRSAATRALVWMNLGTAMVGAVGAIVGGVVLERAGASLAFVLAGIGTSVAAALLVAGRRRGPDGRSASASASPSLRSSFTLLGRERIVRYIVIVVIAGEVLGFETTTLFPALARDVLHADAGGLGAMSAAQNIGGFVGLVALARSGLRARGGWFLVSTAILLGASLAALAFSRELFVALAVLVVVGAAMALLDTIGQTLVQHQVPDHERGAAVGIWYFAIGFGPLGHLGLGAIAGAAGVATTLAVSGLALVAVAAVVTWRGPLTRVA